MSETKIKPRITFGACGCDGARIAGTARASTRTCEHRPSGAGASLAASSSADMRSPLAVLVARVAVRSTADWGYGRFGEDRGVGNVVASARPSMACGARLRPRDGRGIGATRAVRGRMQMALACPLDHVAAEGSALGLHHGRNTPMCSPRASRGIAAPRAVRGRMRGSSASVHLRAVGGHVHVWHQFVSHCHVGLRAPSRHRRGLASTGAGIDVGLLRNFGSNDHRVRGILYFSFS